MTVELIKDTLVEVLCAETLVLRFLLILILIDITKSVSYRDDS